MLLEATVTTDLTRAGDICEASLWELPAGTTTWIPAAVNLLTASSRSLWAPAVSDRLTTEGRPLAKAAPKTQLRPEILDTRFSEG